MSPSFEEQHEDVLQNIEAAIVSVYRDEPELSDHNVDKALHALIHAYQAENTGKPVPTARLRELEQQVYGSVMKMCEWRLGHVEGDLPKTPPKTVDEIIGCLKRIRKSVAFWTEQGGRQGSALRN